MLIRELSNYSCSRAIVLGGKLSESEPTVSDQREIILGKPSGKAERTELGNLQNKKNKKNSY